MTSPRHQDFPRSAHRCLHTRVLPVVLALLTLVPQQALAADNAPIDTLGKPRSGARTPTTSPMADPTRPPSFALPGAAAAPAPRGGAPAGA